MSNSVKKKKSVASENQELDERVRKSKEAVLATTHQLMAEEGLGGVSIDAVSKRSGVAKTTIYRHWPSRSALLLDACSKMGSKLEPPDTGTLKGDLMALALTMAGRLKSARWATIIPSIIDAAERDPEIANLHSRLHVGFMAPLRVVIERAQQRGELPRNQNPSYIVAGMVGPLFYRRWFSRERLDERFVKSIVERVVERSK